MRTAGSHNCSRSAPALQLNVDLLSAKGSKEPIDSSHVTSLPRHCISCQEARFRIPLKKLKRNRGKPRFICIITLGISQALRLSFASRQYHAIDQIYSQF